MKFDTREKVVSGFILAISLIAGVSIVTYFSVNNLLESEYTIAGPNDRLIILSSIKGILAVCAFENFIGLYPFPMIHYNYPDLQKYLGLRNEPFDFRPDKQWHPLVQDPPLLYLSPGKVTENQPALLIPRGFV